MDIQEPKSQKGTDGEDDLLNFDLDDISLDDIDEEAIGAEDDIIELTDLVVEGVPSGTKEDEGIGDLGEVPTAELTKDFALKTDELEGLEGVLEEGGAKEAGSGE
ncbi:MAG: hypothetical protein JXL84_21695, partial [Deltaproteobacteria bacterium]|nr:hypothetical protein [Deltaproteobacteria bacterium]